jgi:hypothetical protein
MKAKIFQILLLVFIFSMTSFSQSQNPSDALNEFWNLALKNDFQTAKEKIDSKSLEGKKRKELKKHFQFISKNKLEIKEVEQHKKQPTNASFLIMTKEKEFNENSFAIEMVKIKDNWKITSFDSVTVAVVSVMSGETFKLITPNIPKFGPLTPYYPNLHPIQFKKIYPENY